MQSFCCTFYKHFSFLFIYCWTLIILCNISQQVKREVPRHVAVQGAICISGLPPLTTLQHLVRTPPILSKYLWKYVIKQPNPSLWGQEGFVEIEVKTQGFVGPLSVLDWGNPKCVDLAICFSLSRTIIKHQLNDKTWKCIKPNQIALLSTEGDPIYCSNTSQTKYSEPLKLVLSELVWNIGIWPGRKKG